MSFDYRLDFTSGDADILPAPADRRWPPSYPIRYAPTNLLRPAPGSSSVYQPTISGWNPLWALECIAARQNYLRSPSSQQVVKLFVNVIDPSDLQAIAGDLRDLQDTNRFVRSTSAFSDGVISNYQAGALPGRYFPNAMHARGYNPPGCSLDYWTARCVEDGGLNYRFWSNGVWPLLGNMNKVIPSAAIETPTSSEINVENLVSPWSLTLHTPTSGLLFDHYAQAYIGDVSMTLEKFGNRRETIKVSSSGEVNSAACSWFSPKPSGSAYAIASAYGNDVYGIFRVARRKVNWSSHTVDDEVVRYVFMRLTGIYIDTEIAATTEGFRFYTLAAMVSSVLSAAGVSDDVTLPTREWCEDPANAGFLSNFKEDRLSVHLVECFPISSFKHTECAT